MINRCSCIWFWNGCVLFIPNLTSLEHLSNISGDFGGATGRSRAKIHVARTTEVDIFRHRFPEMATLGIYWTQITSSNHDIVAILESALSVAGTVELKGFWLANCEFEFGHLSKSLPDWWTALAYFHLMLSQRWCSSMMCFPNNFFTSSVSLYFTANNKCHAFPENFNTQRILPLSEHNVDGLSFPHHHKLKSILLCILSQLTIAYLVLLLFQFLQSWTYVEYLW